MDFGKAVEALKEGKRVQRKGWNGVGLFVFMQVPSLINSEVIPKMTSLPQSVKGEFIKRSEESKSFKDIQYSNQLAIVDLDNNIKGWTPSVSDSLSTDWIILD